MLSERKSSRSSRFANSARNVLSSAIRRLSGRGHQAASFATEVGSNGMTTTIAWRA